MENQHKGSIFVISDSGVDRINIHTFQLLKKGIDLAITLKKQLIFIYVGDRYEDEILKLAGYPIDKVVVIPAKNDNLSDEQYRDIYIECISRFCPEIILMCASIVSRAIASQVATLLDTGLTAECTEISVNNDEVIFTRPVGCAQFLANIGVKDTNIKMCTVKKNVFDCNISKGSYLPEVCVFDLDVKRDTNKVIIESLFIGNRDGELEKAKIIVAGGRGLGEKGFALLKEFARNINAAVGGTRVAVENGWISYKNQIGQTGMTIRPDIYINFGVSGSLQHVVGIESSKQIISVNIDENAPIFEYSHFKIVGDAIEILSHLVKQTQG